MEAPEISTNVCIGSSLQNSNSIHILDSDRVIGICGIYVAVWNLESKSVQLVPSKGGGGIGAVTIEPKERLVAVCEKSRAGSPLVYMYSYDDLTNCICQLEGGTEVAYSTASFSPDGSMLATVGSFPDYMLTLWQWREGKVVLRAKAFSQEVYNVKFSPYEPKRLGTSGTGHIRFWNMAATFTGLKLQGALGKFGGVELSDVLDFVELSDGKYVSTTEGGHLLVWEGSHIKVVVCRAGGPCHPGGINVLQPNHDGTLVLSAGADGYVRCWEAAALIEVDSMEDSINADLEPKYEVGCGLGELGWGRTQINIRAQGGWILE